ncbi:MAG: glucoamylase family protein [Ferruginibacter sp.]
MKNYLLFFVVITCFQCKKQDASTVIPVTPEPLTLSSAKVDNLFAVSNNFYPTSLNPIIKISFSAPIDHSTVDNNLSFIGVTGNNIAHSISYANNDSLLIINTDAQLSPLTKYNINLLTGLQSTNHGNLSAYSSYTLITQIDSTDKFPQLTDSVLLDLVQRQTFKYFWDFGHPVSGMARERNSSGDLVTTGGTGFGIMAIPVAVKRNFITRADGLSRILQIVNFYQNNCTAYHGAYAHWINGATGATIPFSTQDNGADLVETSYLMEGLITARQYFNSTTDAVEIDLRTKINQLLDAVEWNWFRKSGENVLYWHWSPDMGFVINAQVSGWDEALITYVMAASSQTNAIPKVVYDNGWARNGGIVNNNSYYTYQLPLGPGNGGPLFFEHYSFLGINPNGLTDTYANYQTQTTNHTKINYEYCKANPQHWNGYSNLCWGLTASDVPGGYNANEPNNDPGVISPTAALSSMPYTPQESLNALRFFYYKLGDKLWGQYGFYDAFKLSDPWFANSTLAIDQGPIIVMIENYRSGMLWNLFTSAPEIKSGMLALGFTAPYLN